ncbi:MAG: 4-hydroxy-tetrahydrodipicolinate synthase [Simkaniaceae bacterium]
MFSGSLVALITPFTSENQVDEEALRNLIHFHKESGTDGLVVLGTTGEHLSLTEDEKWRVVKLVSEEVKKSLPVIVNCGEPSTDKTIANVRRAKAMGADGVLIVVPYYIKPCEEGIFSHYQAISREGIPIIVYHHPGRTGVKLSSLLLAQITALPNMVGIKEASQDIQFVKELLLKCKTDLHSGDDPLTLELMKMGAEGTISVMANLIPKEWREIVKTKNEELFRSFLPLIDSIFCVTNPIGIKYAMSLRGLAKPYLRLPLMVPSIQIKEHIQKEMDLLLYQK